MDAGGHGPVTGRAKRYYYVQARYPGIFSVFDIYARYRANVKRMSRIQERRRVSRGAISFYLVSKYVILPYYYEPGNVARALSMTNELLELVPSHERALGNRAYYQKEIQNKASQSKKKRGEDGQDDTAIPEQVRSSIKFRPCL